VVEAAGRLREDAAFLDGLARERFEAIAVSRADTLALRAAELAGLPRPLAARVALIALVAAGGDSRRISSRKIDAIVALASSEPGASLDLAGGIGARRSRGLVEFGPCVSPGKS
jgi:hypothetical protein